MPIASLRPHSYMRACWSTARTVGCPTQRRSWRREATSWSGRARLLIPGPVMLLSTQSQAQARLQTCTTQDLEGTHGTVTTSMASDSTPGCPLQLQGLWQVSARCPALHQSLLLPLRTGKQRETFAWTLTSQRPRSPTSSLHHRWSPGQ